MKYAIYNVFHSKLYEDQYAGEEDCYLYAKVGDQPEQISSDKIRNRVVQAKTLPGFVAMGSRWTESEFIFALYRTMKMDDQYLGDIDYIGFSQYDHTTKCRNRNISLASYMNDSYNLIGDNSVLSLASFSMHWEISQHCIAMDVNEPGKQRGYPICYTQMVDDYNEFYGKDLAVEDMLMSPTISLCSSFVMSKKNFMDMMSYATWAAERNNLDQFDPHRRYRAQGGFMERYYGAWIALSGKKLIEFPIEQLQRV